MRYFKKVLLMTFSILLLLPFIPSKTYGKDSIPKRRIVTLIYDDSGSMWTSGDQKPIDNWKYANYALQSLVGLLDSKDLLNVIPMSNPTESKNINLGKNIRQNQIEDILKWTGMKSTPIKTISTAIKKIKGYTSKYPNAEYWMIILTDGVFVELDPKYKNNSITTVTENRKVTESLLNELSQSMKKQNIAFNGALVTIESNLSPAHKEIMGDFKKLWVSSTNGTVIESDSEEKIVESINQVAALITNRDPDETKLFNLNAQFLEDSISLKSPLPLRRITVLNQWRKETPALEITDVMLNGKHKKEMIEGPFRISSPKDSYNLTPTIEGAISHIKQADSGEVIAEGEYEIIFSEPITEEDRRNLRILAEPAVDFNIKVNKVNPDGSLTGDENTFFAGSKMELDVELVQSESKKPINLDNVNKEIFKISTRVDDHPLNLLWDEKKKSFTGTFDLMEKEQINANVKVQIEGLYQKEKEIIFPGHPYRELGLKRVDQKLWKEKVDHLERGKPIEVIPFVNGNEMTEQELKEIFSNVKVKSSGQRIRYGLSQKNNHIFIIPKKKGSILTTATGKVPVFVSLTGKNPAEHAELKFVIHVQDVPWYIRYGSYMVAVFVILLILIWIYGIIVKPRFASNRISMTYERFLLVGSQKIQQGHPTTENFKTNLFERWIIPFKAEKKSIQGILFKATKNPDRICLPKQSQHPNMIIAGTDLSEESGKSDKHLFSNEAIKIEDYSNIEIYTLKTS